MTFFLILVAVVLVVVAAVIVILQGHRRDDLRQELIRSRQAERIAIPSGPKEMTLALREDIITVDRTPPDIPTVRARHEVVQKVAGAAIDGHRDFNVDMGRAVLTGIILQTSDLEELNLTRYRIQAGLERANHLLSKLDATPDTSMCEQGWLNARPIPKRAEPSVQPTAEEVMRKAVETLNKEEASSRALAHNGKKPEELTEEEQEVVDHIEAKFADKRRRILGGLS